MEWHLGWARRLAVLALGGWVAMASAQEGVPLRIGFVCPLSGHAYDLGSGALIGAELAVKEINESGGVLGQPLKLIIRDDKNTPTLGRKAAEELIDRERVALTIGYCDTQVALSALPVFQKKRQVLVIPAATGNALVNHGDLADDYVFRMSVSDQSQIKTIVNDIARHGLRRVAVIADKSLFGEAGLRDAVAFLGDEGLSPVYVGRLNYGVNSAVDDVRGARAAGAEALISIVSTPLQGPLVNARQEANFRGAYYGTATLGMKSALDAAGRAADGAMVAQAAIQDPADSIRARFKARLVRLAGARPIGSFTIAAQSYDAVLLAARALQQTSGNVSGPALKHALEALNSPTAGAITTYGRVFSPTNHDGLRSVGAWLGMWENGEIVFAYGGDAARARKLRQNWDDVSAARY